MVLSPNGESAMTVDEFRRECLQVMGERRAADVRDWSVGYLLATLRHHGPDGERLRQRAVDAFEPRPTRASLSEAR
jgi:hypothetical protein